MPLLPPQLPPARTGFETLDWIVLGGYFAGLAALGAALSRRQSGTEDYFLGGRRMPAWAVALSVVATAISAATFIGGPFQAYSGDLTYLSATIGQFLAILVVAAFFIPVYYRLRVATVYELIGTRFGSPAKQACSWMFMVGRILANGARLFMAGLAASQMLFADSRPGHVMLGIGVLSAVGVAYTLVGGIRAVIWTEVVQTVVLVGAAVAAVLILWHRIPASGAEIVNALQHPASGSSKLETLRLGLAPGGFPDWSAKYTLLTAVLCWSVFNLAAYGTDHDLAQRMLTCGTAVQGSRSAIGAILIGLPITALFMAIGLLLYVFYDRPDLMAAAYPGPRPGKAEEVFLTFIMTQMPAGLAGLMMAGMFAAALSSLSSALNAMSSTLVNDVYKKMRPGLDERAYLGAGRWAMVGWGVVLGLFACVCVSWHAYNAQQGGQTLIDFALGVMNFAYAGLAAVFCAAIFTRRGNGASAIAALAVGFAVVLAMQPWAWPWWAPQVGWTLYTPSSTTVRHLLPESPPSFPWVLLIAFIAAMITCCLGSRGMGEPADA
jgi:SSS family transporter